MIRSIGKSMFVSVHLPVHETNYFYIILKQIKVSIIVWHEAGTNFIQT